MGPPQIKMLETATVTAPSHLLSPPPAAEYLRAVDVLIGWDRGLDVTCSFVECTSRTFHGRPVAPDNPKLKGVA